MEVVAATIEVEDDLSFADLSKQIALLLMDDDDDSLARSPSFSFQQAFSQSCHPISSPSASIYGETHGREIKGTGVFIPRSSLPRRKKRSSQSKYGSFNPKSFQPGDKSKGVISNVTFNNDPTCNCFNSK